jgi:protease II
MNFDLYRTAVSSEDVDGDVDISEASWEKVDGFPWSAGRTLESMSAFSDFLVVEGREDGFSQVWVLSLDESGAITRSTRTEWPTQNCCVYTATASASLSCVGMNQAFETQRGVSRVLQFELSANRVQIRHGNRHEDDR